MRRTQTGAAIGASAVVVGALLVSGLVGVAVHHDDRRDVATTVTSLGKTTTTVLRTTTTVTTIPAAPPAAVTPAGFKRITDTVDHLSVAVPSPWRTPVLTAGLINEQLKVYAAQNPQVAPLIDAALTAAGKIDLGVFAADAATRRVLYVYGIGAPSGVTIDDISIAEVVAELTALGAKNIQTGQILLPVGKADQVSLQLLVKGVTVSELVDFFVLGKRVVFMVLAAPGAQADAALFRQIQETVEPAA